MPPRCWAATSACTTAPAPTCRPDGRPAELAPGVWFDRHGLSYACLPPEAQATHLRVALADYALALVGMSLGALLGARQRRRRDQD
ncbi:hypothetical protein FC419_13035 [Bordetella pertussis]